MNKIFLPNGQSRPVNKPFNQHQAPPPTKMGDKWFKRHIILDHFNKTIYIQIMWDGSGDLKQSEYYEIQRGEWWRHVPKHRRDEYRQVIGSGYKVKAVVFAGADDGEEHVVMQIIDITNDRNMVKDETLQPLAEKD